MPSRSGPDLALEPALRAEDRRPDDLVEPGDRRLSRIDSRRQTVVDCRPVDPVPDVVLARPDDLDRPADLLGDERGLHGEVWLEPPAESAAQERRVDPHLLRGQADRLRHRDLRRALGLGGSPDVAPVGPHVRRGVHRLHRRVVEIRHLVDGLDLRGGAGERACRVALLPRHRALPGGKLLEPPRNGSAAPARVRPFVPLDLQRPAACEGLPVRVGHHGDPGLDAGRPRPVGRLTDRARDLHDVPHAGHGAGGARVVALHPPAEGGGPRHRGDEHPGHGDVDPVGRAPVHLRRRIQPPHGSPQDPEVLRVLERGGVRRREGGRLVRELPVAEAPAARPVHDLTALGPAAGALDAPSLRSRSDQHLTGRGARCAQQLIGAPHAGAAARAHPPHPRARVCGDVPEANQRPLGLQLLGEDHREGRVRALPHLRLVDGEGHDAIGADPDPGVRLERTGSARPQLPVAREVEREHEPGAGPAADLEEVAPGENAVTAHRSPPCRSRRAGPRGGSGCTCRTGRGPPTSPRRSPRPWGADSGRAGRRPS